MGLLNALTLLQGLGSLLSWRSEFPPNYTQAARRRWILSAFDFLPLLGEELLNCI